MRGSPAPPSDNIYVDKLPPGLDDAGIRQIFGVYGSILSMRVIPTNTATAALIRLGSVEEAQFITDSCNNVVLPGLSAPIEVRFANPPKQKSATDAGGYGGNFAAAAPVLVRSSPYTGLPEMSQPALAALQDYSTDGAFLSSGAPSAHYDAATAYSSGIPPGYAEVRGLSGDNLYVGQLPKGIDLETVKGIFGCYGKIKNARVMHGPNTSSALVQFVSADEAAWIVENLNGNIPQGLDSPIVVRYKDPTGHNRSIQQDQILVQSVSTQQQHQQQHLQQYQHQVQLLNVAAAVAAAPPVVRPAAVPTAAPTISLPPAIEPAKKNNYNGQPAVAAGGSGIVCSMPAEEAIKSIIDAGLLPGGAGGAMPDDRALYVSGLPVDSTEKDFYRLLAPFGAIAPNGIKVMSNQDGTCRGFGFVNFLSSMEAGEAVSRLNGFKFPDGTHLKVTVKTDKRAGGDQWA